MNYLDRLWGKNTDKQVDVMPEETMGFFRSVWQACQHLLTAAGANIVGPILMHIDPSMALFTSGLGTLFYNWYVGVPAYLGTSFSYIPVIMLGMTASWGGQSVVAGGILCTAVVSILAGLLVKAVGIKRVNLFMPPVVYAMVVITIGLILAPTAYNMFISNIGLAVLTLFLGILFATKFREGHYISALPVLLSIVIAYVVALAAGQVNLEDVYAAPWFVWPRLVVPTFNLSFDVAMALVAIATIFENYGHLVATGVIVGRRYDDRIAKSLIADGVADALSWSGNPSTTYGENMGVFAITRVYSLRVMYVAGLIAVGAGFLGKLSPLILTIPSGILGGATFLLFGLIAWAGFKLFVDGEIDISDKRNQIQVAVLGTMMVAATVVEFLRPILAGIKPEELAIAPASVANVISSLQSFVVGLRVGGYQIPGVVAVALTGIVLNVVLNFGTILAELRAPAVVPTGASDPE